MPRRKSKKSVKTLAPGGADNDLAQPRPLDLRKVEGFGQPDHPQPGEVEHQNAGAEVFEGRPQSKTFTDGTLHWTRQNTS